MKICALILAHHSPALLRRLCERLSSVGVDIYVHVDANRDQEPFQMECSGLSVNFIRHRKAIYWGGFSMVETVLAMIAEARSRDAYDNYIHVSGDTYPIVTDIELHSFITREILSIDLNETSPNHPDFKRIQKVYLPDCAIGALSPRHWAIERYIDSDFPSLADIEHAIDIKSTQFPWRYAKGSNWWKLSNSAIETILQTVSNAREFINWFRFSAHPDEAFFNTIILNFHKFAEVRPNPVFTKWDGGASPRVLTDLSDLAELQSSAKPFARKFSEASFELLSAMDHELRRKGSARQD